MRAWAAIVFCACASAAERPSERFDELQDLVGFYASGQCMRVARKMTPEDAPRLLMVRKTLCDTFSDRLEHMIAVSGNDAMIQLWGEAAEKRHDEIAQRQGKEVPKRPKRKKQPSKEYYRGVIDVAGTGAYEQQLLKTMRKASEWVLTTTPTPTPEDISTKLQPEIGQWLINVASRSDPHVTSKEMRDEAPEDPLGASYNTDL